MMHPKDLTPRGNKMILGISSYTYTWAAGVDGAKPENPLSAYDLIDKAVNEGLNLVQIADNLPLEVLGRKEIQGIAEYAAGKGVIIEMGGKGLNPEHTVRCLETAELVNSPILRMVIDNPGFKPEPKSVISIIRELLPEFISRNIKLAIENHDRLKAKEFEQIVQGAGSEFVGICLDTVNSLGAGEGFELVSDILIPYTINLHIKDFSISRISHKMGFCVEGKPAGKGILQIPKLLRKVSSTGRCLSAVLELWTPPSGSIEETIRKEDLWAKESIRYLVQSIKDIGNEKIS
jgi:sugar phosphate isomerase/epimerase